MVQQLAVHTVGGVVTPAQPLLVLVPVDSHLEIEAMVSNRDVGFVEPAQQAEIKVATFNFTRYGLLHGKVLSVSRDAVGKDDLTDPAMDKGQQDGHGVKSPSEDEGPVYAARVSLDRTAMQIDGKEQSGTRHSGCDGRDQNWRAPHHQLSPVAAAQIPPGSPARAVRIGVLR
jgi:hemolysin D